MCIPRCISAQLQSRRSIAGCSNACPADKVQRMQNRCWNTDSPRRDVRAVRAKNAASLQEDVPRRR